ncbi:unnamed protein product [Aspergillus oryzae]|uniref:Unnamed protein product n=1 Tax=Aspergillus oryzae TaxID=5062 RepID=A0AAN5BXS1_ASPOZ|nr:unnamed protein product [Aspergillus oryzae]GMG29421.1 unnamed protein product [Aspergillus oryzae]
MQRATEKPQLSEREHGRGSRKQRSRKGKKHHKRSSTLGPSSQTSSSTNKGSEDRSSSTATYQTGVSPHRALTTSESCLHNTTDPFLHSRSHSPSLSSSSTSSSAFNRRSSRSLTTMSHNRRGNRSRDFGRPGQGTSRQPQNSSRLQQQPAQLLLAPWTFWDTVAVNLFNLPREINTRILWQTFSSEGYVSSIDLFEDSHGNRDSRGKIRFK